MFALFLSYLSGHAAKNKTWLTYLPKYLFSLLFTCLILRYLTTFAYARFTYTKEIIPTHLNLDVLTAGVLLRYYYTYHRQTLSVFFRGSFFWLMGGLLLTLPSGLIWNLYGPKWLIAVIPTLNYLGYGLILLQLVDFSADGSDVLSRILQPLQFFGRHSYSIYLWHPAVRDWLIALLFKNKGVIYTLVFFAASLLIGTFFSIMLEFPILKLRDSLFPSLARPRTPLPP